MNFLEAQRLNPPLITNIGHSRLQEEKVDTCLDSKNSRVLFKQITAIIAKE